MEVLKVLLLSIPLQLLFLGVVFHENIIENVGRILCKHGRHKFKKKKYHCKRCKSVRDWPKLVCIQGDKKERPIFPRL